MPNNDAARTRAKSRRVPFNILKTAATLFIAFLICEALYRWDVGQQNISIVIVLAVFAVSAMTDGYWYGIVAALVSVFAYDFFVSEPRFGFSVTLGFPITLSIMLLVALATCAVTTWIKRQMEIARDKEQRAELLYEVNRKLLSSRDSGESAACAVEYLADELGRSSIFYASAVCGGGIAFRQAAGGAPESVFSPEIAVHMAERAAEGGVYPAVRQGACYRPAVAQGDVYGVFAVACPDGVLPPSQDDFFSLIAAQTAQALRVQAMAARQQEALVDAETEKARGSFLRGISHDLRTPLTSIIGASATLLESGDGLPKSTQIQLIEGVQADAEWLLRMVENILSVTRIRQRDMAIVKTEEAAEEVVAESVLQFRRRHPGANIAVRQPEDLLLVPMDALLITQVLNNLLDNSQRHAAGAKTRVTVEMKEQDGFALFSVCDEGPGIGADVMPRLFEIRPAQQGHGEDAARGLGMGLSICKTIVEAHGGWITAQNIPQGGARFVFALPLEEGGSDGKPAAHHDSGG